ncbi:hypothetical protein R8Z57_05075 [Microbacterium sp. M3]|uniref:Uncharacterized protein n=1 Tax=Microbacterium arthrosphaerae TaxID=792652 RepID=A0ABU4H2L9_9MICO|nr:MULTISPECIES: hypothetical protein [Microbacterium]MDW4572149.1 hypothetical protein [Microbacterium arthrosphaerae]MDW7606004.1 hypothetical protein [Microbacterium sp. M3]
MPTVRATRRRGPMTALEGDAPALAIGDTAVRHVRLTPDGLTRWLGDRHGEIVRWDGVRAVTLEPSTTRWLHPAMVDWAGPMLEGLLGGGLTDHPEAAPTFPVRIAGNDGAVVEWNVTQHYLSGYRPREVRATASLLEYLVARAEARVLLNRPAELLDRISALVRTRPLMAE